MGIHYSKAFTLVETLISMVILAVGLLGIAGMQAKGLKSTGNSNAITQASNLAENIIERMQGNPQGVTGGNYSNQTVNGSETDPNCLPNCTSVTLAQTDLYAWGQTVSNSLPSGTGNVTNPGDGTFIITVAWSDVTALGPNASIQTISHTVRIRL